MTTDEARERVGLGAALLDEKRQGWFTRIDYGTLDLSDECLCVLGQVYGSYYFDDDTDPIGGGDSSDYGFHIRRKDDPHDCGYSCEACRWMWRAIQDAWIEAIADRLAPTTEKAQVVDAGATPTEQGVTESA